MKLPTFHSHCHYCDGEGTPEDYIREAVERGLTAHGFSSHGPLPFPNEWSMKKHLVDTYLSDVQLLKDSYGHVIEVYLGMESDYIPGKSSPKNQKEECNLDYVIGSVHYVKQFNSGVPWQIDGSPEEFERGFSEIFNRNPQALISEYYSLIRRMVEEDRPDIVGHIDKIKMHNGPFRLYHEEDAWYLKEVRQTLEVIRSAGSIIEVNTRSIYKRGQKEPYPGFRLLKEIHDMKIPIMLNSDAHHPSEIVRGYKTVLPIITDMGFRELNILQNGSWTTVSISSTS
jgi:histidinol-phosphatase (PHP family)